MSKTVLKQEKTEQITSGSKANTDYSDKPSIINNPGGGDCGAYALIDAIHRNKKPVTQQEIRTKIADTIKNFILLYSTLEECEKNPDTHPSREKIIDLYKNIFGKDDFRNFKFVIKNKLNAPLEDKDTNNETRASLRSKINLVNNIDDWDSLRHMPQETLLEIFRLCNSLDIYVQAIIKDHNWQNLQSILTNALNNGFEISVRLNLWKKLSNEYYSYASQQSIWLNNSELIGYLLTQGYIQNGINMNFLDGTIIQFINNEGKKIGLFNNAQDNSAYNVGQARGSHWQAILYGADILTNNVEATEEEKEDNSYQTLLVTRNPTDLRLGINQPFRADLSRKTLHEKNQEKGSCLYSCSIEVSVMQVTQKSKKTVDLAINNVKNKKTPTNKSDTLDKKDKRDWEHLIQFINSQDLQGLDGCIKEISKRNKKKVKILLNHCENFSLTPFEQAVKSGSIKIIKYLIDSCWELNIQAKSKSGKNPLEIAKDRLSQSDIEENQQIVTYLRGNIMTQENDLEYKKSLFSLDVKIIKAVNNLFQDLNKVYETNNFLDKVIKKHWSMHLDELPDDILPNISEYDNENYYQFRIIEYLKQISEYINILGCHTGSITNQTGNIPWDLLKSIYLDLENNPLLKHNPRKLFENISPNIYKLSQAFLGLTKILDEGYENFCNLKKGQSLDISLTYKTLSDLNFISNNQSLIISSIKNIELIESLDFKDGEEKYALIQCLQNIGEISKHFSKIIKEKLNRYGFDFKNLRDDIGHICEKIPNLTKFIKFFNDKILQDIKNLTTNYKTLLIELKENLQALAKDPSLEISCILGLREDSKKMLSKKWIHKALEKVKLEEDDKIFIGESYVNRQVEVMKFAIKKIQEIVNIVSVKNDSDYNKMRHKLQSPKIHSECLFFLTMVGQSIQSIKTNENFLSIVTFDLLKELDFLKWVRNSLMHLDKVNEKGTLIDYLANDLLTDFSIATHGQKIIEFSKYFDYVLNLLDEFQNTVTHLGDCNYFQEYKGEDKKYLDFDINRKEVALEKVLEKNNKQKHTDFYSQKSNKPGFIIDKIIELKEINQKSHELNIEIIGTFGKFAKFGYSIQGDNSGILVKVSENDILVSLAEFKQYIYGLLKYRIKIIEERQLIEYLELKVDNESDRRKFSEVFLQKTKKNSLEHLENNIKLFQFVKELNDAIDTSITKQKTLSYLLTDVSVNNLINDNNIEIFLKLTDLLHSNDSQVTEEIQTEIEQKHSELRSLKSTSSENIVISQDLLSLLIKLYEEEKYKTQQTLEVQIKNIREFLNSTRKISFDLITREQEPILHSFCKNYQQTKLNPLLELLKVILQKGADIEVQDIYGNTILHNISWYECDEQLLDCIKEYIQKSSYNRLNLDKKCPLEMAIENNNFQLIEFLKDKTDVKEYGKELLIAATKYGNLELIKYLILERHIDCNIQDKNGRPIIHYAIFTQLLANEKFNDQSNQKKYREITKLLLENGAEVSQFYNRYTRAQESPLLWALENKDIELALLLVKSSIMVSYTNEDQNCPIHLAILNLKNCSLQERQNYLTLIKKIAEKAMANGDGLNQEYKGGSETPIYLAAQQEDIEVMKILLQSGANVNYKNYRFISQVLSEVKNLEVIKLFIEHGIRLDLNDCTGFIQNRPDSYVTKLEKLDKINTDEDTLEVLKGKVESIFRKIYPYYIDFDKINTIEKIKEEIVKLKKFLQIKSLEDLSQIKEYLKNHAQLFELYKKKKVDELKELIGNTLINLQVVNKEGKDLFCYALEEQDTRFIKWLSNHNGINANVRFVDPNKETKKPKTNPNKETSYYSHLSKHASGEILDLLHNKGLIDWNKFDDYETRLINQKALKNNDLKAIELLESHKYINIHQSINSLSDENSVKKHLLPYLKVFKQIEQHDEVEELKIAIKSLQNKLVFFKDMSLLHAAVCAGNLDIVMFLIEKVGLNINVQNLSGNTLLDKAVEDKSSLEMLTYLVQNGAQLTRNFDFDLILDLDSDKQTLLLDYIKTTSQIKENIMSLANSCLGNPDAIKVLLELGWDPNKYEENVDIFSGGYTALHECITKEEYNKTLEVLCKSGQIDLEAPICNFFFWATSGVITPVGWALEHNNFVGAKILIEHGASPYKYLGVLLIDALYNEDCEYLKLLLEKSIIIDPEEVSSYLTHWIADSNTADKIFKALQNFLQCPAFGGIKEILPVHKYILIFTEAIKLLPQLSVTDDEKVLQVFRVFKKVSDEQKDLVLS